MIEYIKDAFKRYSDAERAESISAKWTLATAFISLSPFIIGVTCLAWMDIDVEKYVIEIAETGTLMYASMSIISSSYLDMLYSDKKIYDLVSHKRKRLMHIWFFILTSLTLILYSPLQIMDVDIQSHHYGVSFAIIIAAMFFSLKTKTMILESEKQLLP